MRRAQTAGRSAKARFQELFQPWRRRVLPLLLAVMAVGLACGSMGLLIPGNIWKFVLGAAAGAFIVLPWYAYATPPPRIDNWRWGSEAERRTARKLEALDHGESRVWHDLQRPHGGNVDHVVVGPAGVFALDTKDWTGILSVGSSGLSARWREDARVVKQHEEVSRDIDAISVELHDALHNRAHVGIWVQSVVVLWGTFPQRRHRSGNVWFIHGAELAAWLQSWPERRYSVAKVIAFFDEAQVKGIPGPQQSAPRG